jgi:predicted nucleotidyltransferase
MKTDDILKEMERVYGDVFAACLYGSQVCGYAVEDSDYDVLVILDEYALKVKYTYIEGDVEIAFLGVSKKVFEGDVKSAAYGGFIADRIINPIGPLVNEAYLRDQEVARKKAVVDWETQKLVFKHRENAKHLDINILYYPYKKWNKIASVYRPYLYSIENTLREDLREKNLKAVLHGFQLAIDELDILREVYSGWYRIKDEFIEETLANNFQPRIERIKMIEREIEGVVARYLAHKKAGDSDRDLIIRETISKVKREVRHLKEKGRSSTLLDPKKFLIQAG